MDPLNSAIKAEVDGDYRLAIRHYLRLSRQGSMLDRVGIYQAIARCFEKLGSSKKAAYWREKAGHGYMKLPAKVMGQQERAYYAMVEFRTAVQDYDPNLSNHRAVKNYLKALASCLKPGKEGYSHEMLFAAHLYVKTHEFRLAAILFTDCAGLFQKEGQAALARESYRLAARCYEKCHALKLAANLRTAAAAL